MRRRRVAFTRNLHKLHDYRILRRTDTAGDTGTTLTVRPPHLPLYKDATMWSVHKATSQV